MQNLNKIFIASLVCLSVNVVNAQVTATIKSDAKFTTPVKLSDSDLLTMRYIMSNPELGFNNVINDQTIKGFKDKLSLSAVPVGYYYEEGNTKGQQIHCNSAKQKCVIKMRDQKNGSITLTGLSKEISLSEVNELIELMEKDYVEANKDRGFFSSKQAVSGVVGGSEYKCEQDDFPMAAYWMACSTNVKLEHKIHELYESAASKTANKDKPDNNASSTHLLTDTKVKKKLGYNPRVQRPPHKKRAIGHGGVE